MKQFLKFSLPVVLLGLTASCNDLKESDYITTQGFPGCYAVVTDTQNGTVTVTDNVSVGLEVNWTQESGKAIFVGLVIGGTNYPQLTFSNIGLTNDKEWYYSNTNPVASLNTGASPAVDNFKFRWNDRLDMPNLPLGTYYPAFAYSFTIDNRYNVAGSRYPFFLWGQYEVATNGVVSLTSDVTRFDCTPNFKDNTMNVLIYGAQFTPQGPPYGMPKMDIELQNIPMTYDGNILNFENEGVIIPVAQGSPFDGFPCTDIKGSVNPVTGLTLSFVVNGRGTVTATANNFDYREK